MLKTNTVYSRGEKLLLLEQSHSFGDFSRVIEGGQHCTGLADMVNLFWLEIFLKKDAAAEYAPCRTLFCRDFAAGQSPASEASNGPIADSRSCKKLFQRQ